MVVRPIQFALWALVPFLLVGCVHQSDEQILEKAEHFYQVVSLRYEKLLDTADPEKIVLCARSLGTSSYSPPTNWFDSFFKGDSTYREATPLHTVARFIRNDLDELYSHLGYLQTRLLINLPIYTRLESLRDSLVHALSVLKVDEDYIEEARFIDLKRVEEHRLQVEQDQRDYLKKIAERPPYKEEVTYTEIVKEPSYRKSQAKREVAEITVK